MESAAIVCNLAPPHSACNSKYGGNSLHVKLTPEASWVSTSSTHWVSPKPTGCVGGFTDRPMSWSTGQFWLVSKELTALLWHRWASAFRHTVSQSGSGAFQYRTWSSYSGTGLVLASVFLFIPVPDWSDAGQSVIPALIKKSTPHTSTLQTEGILHLHRRLVPCY